MIERLGIWSSGATKSKLTVRHLQLFVSTFPLSLTFFRRENTWVEASELPSQSHGFLLAQFEEELAGKDPDEEFTVESITDKRELEGVIYYKCKWLGFPE